MKLHVYYVNYNHNSNINNEPVHEISSNLVCATSKASVLHYDGATSLYIVFYACTFFTQSLTSRGYEFVDASRNEPVHESSINVVCAYAQSDQSLC